jgi:hypothetical protein
MRIARAWLLRNSDYAKRDTGEMHNESSVYSKQLYLRWLRTVKAKNEAPKTVLRHCPDTQLPDGEIDKFFEGFEAAAIVNTPGGIVGKIEKFHD